VAHTIRVAKHARFERLGPETGDVREVWFVLHGYGQLAASFIDVFSTLNDGSRVIVAPEALNRFYLVDVDKATAAERPVGATWMTREDRENEIIDYVAYLDAVAAETLARLTTSGRPPHIVVLGFSQGAATAARWVARGSMRPAQVIFWGGFLPPEIDSSERAGALHSASLRVVVGSRDRYVSDERLAEEEKRLRAAGLSYQLVRYAGGHGVSTSALRDAAASFANGGA
jgi:predicted esterase